MIRDDDKALFYGGKRNAIFGAYESGKTFVALLATKEVLASGRKVVWIDFEDSRDRSRVGCWHSALMKRRSSSGSDAPASQAIDET